ncbi:ribonuclease H-like domain-containing protein, partial [Tanacetum coccineum]
ILNSMSSELYVGAVYAKSTYELWNDLKDTYDKFDAMFLMGLNDSYLATRSNILTRDPLPLVKAAFAIVSGKESHKNINSVGTTKPTATAFAAKTFDKKGILWIDVLSLLGILLVISTTSNSPVSLSNEQLTRLMNLLNDNGVSTANANIYFNGNTKFVVGNISLRWIVDSGKNQHMTVSANLLVNVIDISNLGLTIGHPQGTQALIIKIKDSKVNNDITLYDALVVPEYTVSLLFVHKLSRDSKLFVGFDESNCYIQDLKANITVRIGRQFNGLYLFDVDIAWGVSSNDDDTELSPDNHSNDDSEATSMDETNNTHPEGNVSDGTDFINDFYENSEFNYEIEGLPVNIVRRSSRQTKLPTSLNDFVNEGKVKYGVERVVSHANLNHENYCFASSLNKSIEPTCYEEAILENNWIDAMNDEIEALNKNHTWDITDLPANRKAIGNKWIWKIKYKANGEIDRYKARLVAKGFNQKEGIDFDEIFSPVVKMSNVRCVIALSVTNNLPLFELDVNNAFLYGDLDEEINMTRLVYF